MKVSANFDLRELVSPDAYSTLGDKAAWLLDPRLVAVVQAIREIAGKTITVNNWHAGGQYKDSGYRMPNSLTGATLSQHRFGRAADLKIAGLTPSQGLQMIKDNWPRLSALGLTTVEDVACTPTWLHVDVRTTGQTSLLIVKG
jgi:uncharacterized protein YcbK (DUF882 family)